MEGESATVVQAELDRRIVESSGRASFEADATVQTTDIGTAADERLKALAAELDLAPDTLRDTLESALAIRVGRPQIDCAGDHTCKLLNPGLPGWRDVVDESVRRKDTPGVTGSLPRLAFRIDPFLKQVGERLVFQPKPDVLLMHLSHPLLQRALSVLTRRRFPGAGDDVSRWTVRYGDVPAGADGVVMLTVEELAVNDLRETFHHWVRTVSFPVKRGGIGPSLPHVSAAASARSGHAQRIAPDDHVRARQLFEDAEPDLRSFIGVHAAALTEALQSRLVDDGKAAREQEAERYRSRQREVSAHMSENTIARLEREVADLKAEKQKGWLFDDGNKLDELSRSIEAKQFEIERRRHHYEEVRDQLERERERILKYLLPRRYAMSGTAQVFPVTVEVRLPLPGGHS